MLHAISAMLECRGTPKCCMFTALRRTYRGLKYSDACCRLFISGCSLHDQAVHTYIVDREVAEQVLYKHTLGVLSEALALWPGAPVRVHYIDKLLTANQQANLNPPPALLTGLQVMRRVLDAQVLLLLHPILRCPQLLPQSSMAGIRNPAPS